MMNEAQLRIEVKGNSDRNRFWEALQRLEEGIGTKREQKHDRPLWIGTSTAFANMKMPRSCPGRFTIGDAYRPVRRLLFRAANRVASTPVTCVSRCLSCYAKCAAKKKS
jgi:hypothetical protein